MTLDEAIKREEALVYSYGERYKRGGEPVGELDKLEAEHKQMVEWLRELKAYRKAHEEICYQPQSWEYGQGIQTCIDIITDCLKEVYREVNADERI